MGFTLYFHFSPNDYFNNEVLTKTYELKCEPQEDDPFAFEVIILSSISSLNYSFFSSLGTRNHQMHRKYNRLEEREESDSETSQKEAET